MREHNDGDPVVVYDQLANRWLLSEFVAQPADTEQYAECIAVSTTSSATGSYYLYEFDFGRTFHDYPKLGVWPDAYYMSSNEFPDGSQTSAGAGAFAFERAKMLAGQPARVVYFDESAYNPAGGQYIGQLPTDLDGSTLPPAGSPNLFAEIDDASTIPPTDGSDGFVLRLWKFHVDWANPSNSTFGDNGQPSYKLPVAPYVRPQCVYGYGDCAPQKGGPQGLDILGDRLMFRMNYRNFGSYASVLLNHTVKADARSGIRWYELRIPKGGAPSIYQQGTYAPTDSVTNPIWRWMGSIAQDKNGDIAAGFSASGPNDYPSVRYTGRAAGDPLGPDDPGRAGRVHRHRPADRGRGPLGRLQRPDGRPERRLHVLVHAGVPRPGHGRDRNLADAGRLVQVPGLRHEKVARSDLPPRALDPGARGGSLPGGNSREPGYDRRRRRGNRRVHIKDWGIQHG